MLRKGKTAKIKNLLKLVRNLSLLVVKTYILNPRSKQPKTSGLTIPIKTTSVRSNI